nr:SNF2-related protein [Streptococcus loxodontisalivarius]
MTDLSQEVAAFLLSSPYGSLDSLKAYIRHFSEAGLNRLDQLNQTEKELVRELSTYHLAYRFHLLQEKHYQALEDGRFLSYLPNVNLVNISKVAHNLSDRISRDIETFSLTYEPETVRETKEKSSEEIYFKEEETDLEAYRGKTLVASLSKRDFSVRHEADYEALSFLDKFAIISRFDQVKEELEQQELDKEKVEEELSLVFREEPEQVSAYLMPDESLISYLDLLNGQSHYLDGYQDLSLDLKVDLLSYYDTVRNHLTTPKEISSPEKESVSSEASSVEKSDNGHSYTFLNEAGIKSDQLTQEELKIYEDAYYRFDLNPSQLRLLASKPFHEISNLALSTELLSLGIDETYIPFFLGSELSIADLQFLGRESLTNALALEVLDQFEKYKLENPEEDNRSILDHLLHVRKELTDLEEPQANQLVQAILERFPVGSYVTYREDTFELISVDNAGDNLVRLELLNDFTYIIEENPVLYVGSLDEVTQSLHLVVEEEQQVTKEESQSELDLFDFIDGDPIVAEVIDGDFKELDVTHEVVTNVSEKEVVDEGVQDFVFPEDLTDFYPKGTREKIEANVRAIALVKKLESDNRQASPEEQHILAKYVGWGGLANTFFDDYNPKFERERSQLRDLVSPKEFSDMKQSSLTAYYTDPMIIRQMWQKLERSGFKGGRILDPSMGTGNFFSAMPLSIRENSELYGVELDGITGAIAKQLHPNSHISITGFESTTFQDNAFDLVISNVPFANSRIADKAYEKPYLIHDYFLKKSLDLVHDGGQVAIISSIGTMDKRTDNVLKDVKDQTQFLGGVRLPETAFKRIAGTSVTTDILFFQKDLDKVLGGDELAFSGSIRYEDDHRIWLNPYFDGKDNPQVLGQYDVKQFNGGMLSVKATDKQLDQALSKALGNIKQPIVKSLDQIDYSEQVFQEVKRDSSIPRELEDSLGLYAFGYQGNTVYYRDETGIRVGSKSAEISYYIDQAGDFQGWDSGVSQKAIDSFVKRQIRDSDALDVYVTEEPAKRGRFKGFYKKTVFYESPLSEKEVSRIKGMVDLRDLYQSIIELQRDYDYDREVFAKRLGQLNQTYDRFVKAYGFLNNSVNRNLFDSDDKYSLLASLEDEVMDSSSQKVTYKKSLAFDRALVRPDKTQTEVTSALDALNASLADGRGVDLAFMRSIYPSASEEELIKELGHRIIPNPEAYLKGELTYVSRQDFLSGDILSKLEVIDLLQQEENSDFDWEYYRQLLEEVRPALVTLADIDYRIGSRWIPDEVYGKFACETFLGQTFTLDSPDVHQVINRSQIDGTMTLTKSFSYKPTSAHERSLGVSGSLYERGRSIFENLLNSNQPTITRTIQEGDKKRVVTDVEKTSLLRSREQDLQGLFQDFVAAYPEIGELLEDVYNKLYNRTVSKIYDGCHLEIDGLAQHISLRPHQMNAIQRIVEEKRALLAHEVGSGKTLTMLGAGFKLKELGLVNKPLYVVPSSLTAQFGQEILKFFPTKNVFVTTKKDFTKARRKQFVSRIITGDYDAIVIGDSQFERIPMSKEKQETFIQDKLEEMRALKTGSDNNYTVKEAERSIKSLENQLKELQNLSQDTFIEFENLGIDFLFVDEAHHFKNIRPITGLGNVAGITTTTSKKNVDMEMKVRQVQSEHDHRHVVFATGTPVSNSISELYTMMHYVQPDVLERYQVQNFDSWVGAFGHIENSMKLAPTGDKYQPKKRFKKFVNLPELMRIYKETADIQTSDMLDLPVPVAHIIPVESELTENQKAYLNELVERSDKIKSGSVDPSEDNMLVITSEARKLAIDMRLLDPSYNLTDNNKLLQVVDNVERIYREGMMNKATQMIFSDIGTPKKGDQTGFDVYHELKELLVDRGIPQEEIAFVHDANTDDKKNSLSRKVNSGDVRILMASTEKGGTGLNVQAKMKAVHHLDVPWRPSDVTQRNGRLIRQGNEHDDVDIYHYITKGSFDNYLWATQENKLRYIKQIMTSKDPVRSAEDIDEQTMTASDFKALATGNPFLKLKMELENELGLLENERRAFQRTKDDYRRTIHYCEENLPSMHKRLDGYEQDIAKADSSKTQAFAMTLGNQVYTERPEAGDYLNKLLKHLYSETKELRTLGHYRGFDLKALTRSPSEPLPEQLTLRVVGQNQYSVTLDLKSDIGTIQRISNTIDHISDDQVKTRKMVEELQDKHRVAKEKVDALFPKEGAYQELRAKYDVIGPLVEKGAAVEEIEEAMETFQSQMENQQRLESFPLELA